MAESTSSAIPNIKGSIIGDAQALRVRSTSFLTRNIGQSSPYPSDVNTLTVTLVTSMALSACDAAAITVSGLTGTQTASTVSMPITDVPVSHGVLALVSSATVLQLSDSEPAVDAYYEGYAVYVDIDGSDVTTGDVHITTVISYSGQNRRVTLATAVVGTAVASTSTYALTARPKVVFGSTAEWVQTAGTLKLSVQGITSLTQAITSATSTTIVVASATSFAVGGHITVHAEIMRVDGISGTTLTVTRQRSGTGASPHAAGAAVCSVLVPGLQYVLSFQALNPSGYGGPVQVGVAQMYTIYVIVEVCSYVIC
jgi:hypothetical protein